MGLTITILKISPIRNIAPKSKSLIVASINNQTITIEEATVSDIIIRLNDKMIDMDKNVIVKYLGTEIFNGIVHRNKKTILNSIEDWASEKGFIKCILETGNNQVAAINFYKKSGYKSILNYGQYAQMEDSNCFEKLI